MHWAVTTVDSLDAGLGNKQQCSDTGQKPGNKLALAIHRRMVSGSNCSWDQTVVGTKLDLQSRFLFLFQPLLLQGGRAVFLIKTCFEHIRIK